MTRFPCPNCALPIETPDHLVGTSLGCPHCGNINVVPPLEVSQGGSTTYVVRELPPAVPRIAYILLAVFVGTFGIHNFLAGYTGRAVVQLVLTLTIVASPFIWVWAIIEACTVWKDAHGRVMT